MISRTAGYLDAINHLPTGSTLVVHQFSWDDYERLVEELSDRHDLRVSYDRGKLELMSPLPEHEKYAKLIEHVAYFVGEKLELEIESYGIATWKRRRLARGVEADACFLIASANRVVDKRKINLESDPPPDVVVEINVTNESLSKFFIYAALSVSEIWRHAGKNVQFYELAAKSSRNSREQVFAWIEATDVGHRAGPQQDRWTNCSATFLPPAMRKPSSVKVETSARRIVRAACPRPCTRLPFHRRQAAR